MSILRKIGNVLRGRIQVWGNKDLKRGLWNKEYATGRWKHCENTQQDPVYSFVEKHARGGRILDLGCGAGNTGNELAADKYREYVGVDVSDVAVAKASERSRANGRGQKNRYFAGDIAAYVPEGKFDLILFRESIYYLPPRRIVATLDRYSQHLSEGGVFVVAIYNRHAYAEVARILEDNYQMLENHSPASSPVTIKVFRERSSMDTFSGHRDA